MKFAVFALLPAVLALQQRELKYSPPDHEQTEFHKGDCIKWEEFAVELAFNRTTDGTVVIIGAHNHDNDLWKHLTAAKNLDKIFVEPLIPSLFHDFEKDAHALTNVKVVNAAVTGTDSPKEKIYCTGSAHPEHIVFKKKTGKQHRLLTDEDKKGGSVSIPTNIIQTCSLDRNRLHIIHELDGGASGSELDKHITEHSTETLSMKTFLNKYVTTPLRMLQIDVEGSDDKIVLNIPLEEMEHKPHVILFEHALLDKDSFHAAMKHLHNNFYITCGFHHNIMAYNVQWMQSLTDVAYPDHM